MLKKIAPALLLVVIFMSFQTVSDAAVQFDTATVSRGRIGISCEAQGKKIKVMIEKGSSKYTYNLSSKGEVEYFPLQMGNGEYKISVLENVSGTKYSFLDTTKVSLNLSDPNLVYLNSVQNIRWNENYSAIKHGKKLSGNEPSMDKKMGTLYNYVVKNYKYDYDKIPKLTTDYNPDIEATYQEKKGICYDYSALMAGMQRSQGLPTKLVKGYAAGVEGYHAWNEVLINGNWVVVDTTFDAAMWGGKANYTMIKKTSDYKKVNEY